MQNLQATNTISSLELVKEINKFRNEFDGKAELKHKNLLQVIRDEFSDEIESAEISATPYIHPQNNQTYEYFNLTLSQAKQVLVRESKAVRKATIKYIEELETNVTHQIPATDPMSLMRAQFQVLEMHDEKLNELEDSVNFLIDTTRISSLQEQELASVSKRRVIECCTGYETKAYTELAPKVFARIGSDFKKYFKIPRRGELPKKDYDEAIEFLSKWVPNVELQLAIKNANSQMRIGA